MIKLTLSLLFILTANFSLAQKSVDPDAVIRIYADSINRVTKAKEIPSFIMKECFAAELPMIMYHVDVRNLIANKVSNPKALKIILRKNDKRLKKACADNTSVDRDKTMYDYLSARLKHLEDNKVE